MNMNVADLIAELSKYPDHLPVKVLLSTVIISGDHEPYEEPLCENDAIEAEVVRPGGNHVLIVSK